MHAHDSHKKALVKLMGDVGRVEGRSSHEVFRDFLEASYRSIRGSVMKGTEGWQANEDEYMKIVQRCRKPAETMRRFSEMLGHTVEALEAECSDFLGPVFMDIGGSKGHGQFFTPHSVSKVMATMQLGDMKAVVEESGRGFFTAQEPAVGMGGMVLAVAELMREQGLIPAMHCHWHMIDVEWKAMAGCYIQTSLAGVNGVVFHGNALSLETWSATPTPMAIVFPRRVDQKPVADQPSVAALPPTVPSGPTGAQLTFDFQA